MIWSAIPSLPIFMGIILKPQSKVPFTNDMLGPKVTWAVMLLDFASRFPHLPEWQVTQNLRRRVCQFRFRFQRLTVLKGVQVTDFKHANSLKDFHLGRLSGCCGSFNPSSPLRVWFSLVKFIWRSALAILSTWLVSISILFAGALCHLESLWFNHLGSQFSHSWFVLLFLWDLAWASEWCGKK